MDVAVIGAGYVGLVTGACLAERGHRVVCVDRDRTKLEMIASGTPPIHEDGLETLLRRNVGGNLRVSDELAEAVAASELSIIAVGTPFAGERIDLGAVIEAARGIGRALVRAERYHTVVVKSTVVPGTTDGVVRQALEEASGLQAGRDFGLAMNPEFLREGVAVSDFLDPDRIVCGGRDGRTHQALSRLYASFECDKVLTDNTTAEMIKYSANALLATLISFSNEIGNLCATLGGVDIDEVLRAVHLDRRMSPRLEDGRRVTPELLTYLAAGCGFGGSCFPKDVKALIAHGAERGSAMPLLRAVMEINEGQPQRVVDILRRRLGEISGSVVAVLGLAFKPGTDDLRESPALAIVRQLAASRAAVRVYDPVAMPAARARLGEEVQYCTDLREAVADADAVVVATAWPEFLRLPQMLAEFDRQPVVVDGRRMLPKGSVARYAGIGLGE